MDPRLATRPGPASVPASLRLRVSVLALALTAAWAGLAHAGSGTLTLQLGKSAVDDNYNKEDNQNENNGDKGDMRVKASTAAQNRQSMIRIPLSGLAGKTVVRAWLELQQSAGGSTLPIDTRAYPITESWAEMIANWNTRDQFLVLSTPWSTPGGTHGAYWVDRALVSSSTNGGAVRWQVGPLVQAWNSGDLPNYGFLLVPVRAGATREVAFRTSDQATLSLAPKLVIDYTDEAPAIRSGFAEIQPRAVRAGSSATSLTAWLDVDATGSTPSGNATGFDALLIAHGGGLHVTGVSRFVVGGSLISTSLISWTDDGSTITFRFPRVRVQGQVQIDFQADILAPASTTGLDLPMSVDDSATPGAGAQQLWPGNADRVAGNGDDWILTVSELPAVSIDLLPNAATMSNLSCLALSLAGRDALGNVFAVVPDSIVVLPRGMGTIGPGLSFCATTAGTAKLIACSGALRDTSTITIQPERLTRIESIALRARDLTTRDFMAPGETLFVDVLLSDGDGLDDVTRIDFDLRHAAAPGALTAPWGASFHWERGGGWSLDAPTGTSWKILPALCTFDEASTSTSPGLARLAFVVGKVARASATGEWSVAVSATSLTPASKADSTLAGLDVPAIFSLKPVDSLAAFSPGLPGANDLPLAEPEAGHLAYDLTTNAPVTLQGVATDLVGTVSSTDTLKIGAPQHRMSWSLTESPADGGSLDTAWSTIAALPAPEVETPARIDLHLWLDHPALLPSQDYLGSVALRLAGGSPVALAPEVRLPARATVVTTGLAAQLALAEVTPHSFVAGGLARTLQVDVRPLVQGTDSGVDRLRVAIPPGYGTPAVTGVLVAGSPVAFTDHSAAGLADVVLASRVTFTSLIRVTLRLDAPAAADSAGAPFVVSYDDAATSLPPQAATEGDANGVSDGNNWNVQVNPGPLATLAIAPGSAQMFADSVLAFTARGEDAFGNHVAVNPVWSVDGGIGTIGAGGSFRATTPGSGGVLATSGAVADTAEVTVLPARAIRLRSVTGPAVAYQGETGVPFTVRLENLAPTAVALDTLRLGFGRAVAGDADGDFTIVAAPAAPVWVAPGVVTTFAFTADVAAAALAAPLAVQATASGIEQGSGLRLRDAVADSALALTIVPGGIELTASQSPAPVMPGSANVPVFALRVQNHFPVTRTLASLVLANRSSGPGDPEQLDTQLGELRLFADDGDGAFEADRDSALTSTSALSGAVAFARLALAIPALGSRTLFVAANLPASMRDGDLLDLEVAGPADLEFEAPVGYGNAWPVGAPGAFVVDGMVAAVIGTTPVGPRSIHPGETDQLALDLRIPANGYTADVLLRLGVVNLGTAQPVSDLARLRAWADNGDGQFSAAADTLLGALVHTGGGRWQLDGLSRAIPLGGKRVFVTADASPQAANNATVILAVPAGPDPGIGCASGDSGPRDVPVVNSGGLIVSELDRVTVAALPVAGGSAHPGDRQQPLLRLAFANNYTASRTLTTLVLDDRTTGPGTAAERDQETRLLTLRQDTNGNGVFDDDATDPVLATGFFQGGEATFQGIALAIPALGARQLLVMLDVSSTGARDGDALGAVVEDANRVAFAEPTTVNGTWPLDSGARWTIDGFVAAQATRVARAGVTVGPGDGPLLALDVILPANGYAADILRGLRLVNRGTASASDLAAVQLWRDGGDGVFSAGGDDVLLAPLTATSGGWTSALLTEAVSGVGARFFVSVTVAASPAESVSVRLAIPAGGVEFDSGNDGPLDGEIANPEELRISSAPLLASMELPAAATVGQTLRVTMVVRNAGGETVRNVAPGPLDISGTASLALLSGPTPASFDLAPAEADTFVWQYRADGTGEARLAGAAAGLGDPSGLVRAAPRATTALTRIFVAASELDLSTIQTMPIRVNRGQTSVVPFSLTLAQPGGAEASDARVDRLRVRLEQESGAPIVPASLVSRIVVNEGTNVYLTRTALETAGNEMDLVLATPATVTGTQPTTLSLRLDISDTTTVPTFRLVIADSTAITAQDQTSGAPVAVSLGSGAWPVRSGVAQVVDEATRLEILATGQDTVRAGRGTSGAVLMRLRLTNPGVTGISSAVRVSSLALALTDSAGADQPSPGATISALRIVAGAQVLATHGVSAGDAGTLAIALTPPLSLPANAPLDVAVVADIAGSAPLGRFGARLLDSTFVDARDANTLAPVPVEYTPRAVQGGRVTVEAAAETVIALGTPRMPAALLIGSRNVPVLSARLRHPGQPGTARLRVDRVAFLCVDDLRRALVPATYLDRVRVTWNGAILANLTALPAIGNRIDVPLAAPPLEPGDSARVEVFVDVDAAAPATWFEMLVPAAEIAAVDANTDRPLAVAADTGATLPLQTGLARLTPPARELSVGFASLMAPTLAADGRPAAAGRLALRNAEPAGAGPIPVDHLVVRAADQGFAPLALGAAAARVEAWVAGVRWAESAPLTPDSVTATLAGASTLEIAPGTTLPVEIRIVTRTSGNVPSLRVGFDQAGIGVVQPASALLAINVRPEPGAAFPMWSEAASVTEATLGSSYTNYPNPFAAGREVTTLSWYLPSPARVWLRVLNARGEPVARILDGAALPAGMQTGRTWDGRNGRGETVYNGVYIAELEVRFDGGGVQQLRRKVAVVR